MLRIHPNLCEGVRVRLPAGTNLLEHLRDGGITVVFATTTEATACAEAILEAAGGLLERRPREGQAVFRRAGEYWTVAHESGITRLRDTKGMRYLAILLAEPGRELCALDLVAAEGACPPPPAPSGSGDPLLDPESRARLADLRQELERAEGQDDLGHATRVQSEVEFVTGELTAGTGLNRRDRRVGSGLERARVAVTLRIREAIARIVVDLPQLGRHLAIRVETGRICVYRPDGTFPIRWLL